MRRSVGLVVDILIAIFARVSFRDVLLFSGLGLLGYGIYLIYPPGAFIVPGAVLVGVAVLGVR